MEKILYGSFQISIMIYFTIYPLFGKFSERNLHTNNNIPHHNLFDYLVNYVPKISVFGWLGWFDEKWFGVFSCITVWSRSKSLNFSSWYLNLHVGLEMCLVTALYRCKPAIAAIFFISRSLRKLMAFFTKSVSTCNWKLFFNQEYIHVLPWKWLLSPENITKITLHSTNYLAFSYF